MPARSTRSCWPHRHADLDGRDGDLLIAAQALKELAVVVTSNERHFQGIVEALPWEKLLLCEGE